MKIGEWVIIPIILGALAIAAIIIIPNEGSKIDVIENLGAVTNVHGQVLTTATDEVDVTASSHSQTVFEVDKSIPVWIAVENCHLFTADGTALPRDVKSPTWK